LDFDQGDGLAPKHALLGGEMTDGERNANLAISGA
jgi:hypothetical protein